MKTYQAILMLTLAAFLPSCMTTPPRSPMNRESTVQAPASPDTAASYSETSETEHTIDLSYKKKGSAQSGDQTGSPPVLPKTIGKFTSGLVAPQAQIKPATPSPADKDKQKIVFNFDKADITEVTSQIFGDYLKLNYVLDPALQGRISLYLEGEFTKEELLQMITRVYEANNVSIVPRKGMYYIQPVQRSSSSTLPIADSLTLKDEKGGTKPVVVIYRLANMDAKQAINLVQPFLSPGRPIKSDNMTNSIIFVENTENAQTIVEVLKALDINVLQEVSMEIVPVQAISPQDAAQSMEALMNKMSLVKDSAIKNNLAYIPLQSFGGVLILAQSADLLRTAKQWLTALDVHGAETGEQIYVYFVQNGLAKDIGDILNQLFGLKGGGGRLEQQVVSARQPASSWGARPFGSTGTGGRSAFGTGSSSSSFGRGTSTSSSAFGGTSTGQSLGSSATGQSFGSTAAGRTAAGTTTTGGVSGGVAGQRTGAYAARAGVTGGAAGTGGLSGEVIIIPDEINNAIIIRANALDYGKIKKTIETLDIVPRAVLIEVLVAEVRLNKDLQYGVRWFFQNADIDRGKGAGSQNGLTPAEIADLGSTVAAATASGGLSLAWASTSKNVAAMLTLLSNKTKVTILSNPTLLATDNKEASITVGGRQPVPTGSAVSSATSDALISSIQYEETGVILNVTPHINAGGLVRLEVEQTIRDVGANALVGNGNVAPTFTERNIKTTLLAQNGSTAIIGGIILQNRNDTKGGIPWLSDIPIISPLFSTNSRSNDRTELLIAITPHVVSHKDSASTMEFLDKLRILKRRVERERL